MPVLCVVFALLWIFCIVVCAWWTRKRKKERERALRSEETTVNNQLEPLRCRARKDNNSHKGAEYERKKLMGSGERTCEGEAEEGEGGEGGGEGEESAAGAGPDEELVAVATGGGVDKCSPRGGGLICTWRSGLVKAPHRTGAYSPKDNRCKNLNAAALAHELKDQYV